MSSCIIWLFFVRNKPGFRGSIRQDLPKGSERAKEENHYYCTAQMGRWECTL